jgi:hypothetical protein
MAHKPSDKPPLAKIMAIIKHNTSSTPTDTPTPIAAFIKYDCHFACFFIKIHPEYHDNKGYSG